MLLKKIGYDIKMLEITIGNCNKCDIETINDLFEKIIKSCKATNLEFLNLNKN